MCEKGTGLAYGTWQLRQTGIPLTARSHEPFRHATLSARKPQFP